MILVDVNVIIYANRPEVPQHRECLSWLEGTVNSGRPFGMSELVLSSFIRIISNPRVFVAPTPLHHAIRVANELLARDNCVHIRPGPSHWSLFTGLCIAVNACGNLVTDAYLAALAIEHDCDWISTDSDFARFPGLRWRQPGAHF